jgi:UDP-N-acetylmuramate-alanine ligase
MFSSEVKSVHFVGIGGTAMASAAAAMQDKRFDHGPSWMR